MDINKVFTKTIKKIISNSLWARYIAPGPTCYVLNEKIFVYINPCDNFWDLYNTCKPQMTQLGIYLKKVSVNRVKLHRYSSPSNYQWRAHIPISCLCDKVFKESGLIAYLINDLTRRGRENELPTYLRRS